jgi:LysM repeat protein
MTALLPIIAVLLAAPPATEVVVQAGETHLSQVAKRTLGDPRSAEELQALNGLPSDTVTPGTTLKLPGPDRGLALSALAAARNAVAQAGTEAAQRAEASRRLLEAESLFHGARYGEAAKVADAAWQLVSASAAQPTRFAVEVAEDGRTRVSARTGQPVRVEGDGVTRPVYSGQSVTVEKGKPPTFAELPPAAPVPLAPADNRKLRFRPSPNGLGPVAISWQAVAGAQAYEVEVVAAAGKSDPLILKVDRAEAKLPPLAAGRYTWSVRALGTEGLRSAASPSRAFELAPDALKLEVKGKGFQ